MAKEKAPKVVKTPEELKAEALQRDALRYDQVNDMLQIGSTLKGEQREKFFKNISGKKEFQLTLSQWKRVEESKAFKQVFLDEIRAGFNLLRTSGSIVRVGGEGKGRLANGANIKKRFAEAAVGENGSINQVLVDAGVKLGDAVDALRESFKAEIALGLENHLDLKMYIRNVVETPAETVAA